MALRNMHLCEQCEHINSVSNDPRVGCCVQEAGDNVRCTHVTPVVALVHTCAERRYRQRNAWQSGVHWRPYPPNKQVTIITLITRDYDSPIRFCQMQIHGEKDEGETNEQVDETPRAAEHTAITRSDVVVFSLFSSPSATHRATAICRA